MTRSPSRMNRHIFKILQSRKPSKTEKLISYCFTVAFFTIMGVLFLVNLLSFLGCVFPHIVYLNAVFIVIAFISFRHSDVTWETIQGRLTFSLRAIQRCTSPLLSFVLHTLQTFDIQMLIYRRPPGNLRVAAINLPPEAMILPPAAMDLPPAAIDLEPEVLDIPLAAMDLPPAAMDLEPEVLDLPSAAMDLPLAERFSESKRDWQQVQEEIQKKFKGKVFDARELSTTVQSNCPATESETENSNDDLSSPSEHLYAPDVIAGLSPIQSSSDASIADSSHLCPPDLDEGESSNFLLAGEDLLSQIEDLLDVPAGGAALDTDMLSAVVDNPLEDSDSEVDLFDPSEIDPSDCKWHVVKDDERSLFRSVVRAVFELKHHGHGLSEEDEQKGADSLRASVVEAMESAETVREEGVLEIVQEMDSPLQEYLKWLSRPTTKGGATEIAVISAIIQSPINVYIRSENAGREMFVKIETYGDRYREDAKVPICLLLETGCHYDFFTCD